MTTLRLTLKASRFEVLAIVVLSLLLTAGAVATRAALDNLGLTEDCIGQWLVNPDPLAGCGPTIEQWSSLSSEVGGRLLTATTFFPVLAGLILGVIVVGREVETGTAELAWSLAWSRSRWFRDRVVVFGLVLSATLVPLAIAMVGLEEARTANGIWISGYSDADLFGAPVVARGFFGLGLGLAYGAVAGRVLPALMVGVVTIVVVVSGLAFGQALFGNVATGPQSIGGPGYVASYLANPDVDFRFATKDGRLLTAAQAEANAPAGVGDLAGWLQANYSLIPLGVSGAKTGQWQLISTGVYVLVALAGGGVAWLVVNRRRPR